MAKNKNIIQKESSKVINNSQKITKLSPQKIHVNTATLNNKNAEVIILENYDLLTETGYSTITLSYDFVNINENIIGSLYPYVIITTTDGFSLFENADISLSYYWKKFDSVYRLYARIEGTVNQVRTLPDGGTSIHPTISYLTYKVAVRNKKVWSEIEKVIT